MTTHSAEYTIEVYVLQRDKRIDGVVVQEWFDWMPVGDPRPSLDQARAALQALRAHYLYRSCKMRIMSGGFTLIEVEPEAAPLVQLHNGRKA